MFCIQYDEDGFIGATVTASTPPLCERQLILPDPVDIAGLMVDVASGTLIPAPRPEPDIED